MNAFRWQCRSNFMLNLPSLNTLYDILKQSWLSFFLNNESKYVTRGGIGDSVFMPNVLIKLLKMEKLTRSESCSHFRFSLPLSCVCNF